ncbi:hypothetical protein U27_03038 [Candidatus Vecturithrix granuli]|uniref:Uncharacterized protein n=1 Tax=Vecturithrix granuli TaxID=1499967 RepID=A0A081BUS1_VECG1|nr:hypothetical protein U27_03038 [Candidatus Vecturithrix granuli]
MSRDAVYLPEIPATATEEYLEKLTEKILMQLEKATNRNVRLRLNALLQEAQRRKKKLLEEKTPTTSKGAPLTEKQYTLKMFDTAKLSEEEQQQIKERLRYVLEDIQKQRPESQQISFVLATHGKEELAEISPQALLNTVELTEQEYQIVKERMKGMLAEVNEQRQEQLLNMEMGEEEEEEILLEEEIIPGEESLQADLLLEGEIVSEEDMDAEDVILLEDEVFQDEESLKDVSDEHEEIGIDEQEDEFEEPFSFETICRKVKVGEPLILFSKTALTEREQAMLVAFEGYIKQTKGLKRQQVFDIQHLTARSIRDLDQLFKTYHLQGYLSAELHNIYNRLLNLRSRISTLLS